MVTFGMILLQGCETAKLQVNDSQGGKTKHDLPLYDISAINHPCALLGATLSASPGIYDLQSGRPDFLL